MANPRACGWYLKRLQFFLDMIGKPERKIPHYIHVTGTSGKGSVTSIMHSILQAAGKKVGSTYSPHPSTITERWKIGNHFMSKTEFAQIVTELKAKFDKYLEKTPYDMLSFFEITEAIGLTFFARHKIEWVVMEVACGGRTDSSNIIPWKDVAIITNIGVDHVGILGNNKKEIAYEKAGIIKKHCAIFTMEKNAKIREIFWKECKKLKNNNLHYIKTGTMLSNTNNLTGTDFTYKKEFYHTPTLGSHQINNSILCVEVAEYLKIPHKAIKKGLNQVEQPLRMEIVAKKPLTILDGAHNADKMRTTVQTTKNILTSSNNLHLLIGFSNDKNIKKMLAQLATLKPKTVAVTRNTGNPFRKVAEPKFLANTFKTLSPKSHIKIFLDPSMAFAWSKKQAKKTDVILATGSIFVSGQLR